MQLKSHMVWDDAHFLNVLAWPSRDSQIHACNSPYWSHFPYVLVWLDLTRVELGPIAWKAIILIVGLQKQFQNHHVLSFFCRSNIKTYMDGKQTI